MADVWNSVRTALVAVANGASSSLDRSAVERFIGLYGGHLAFEEAQLLPAAERLLDTSLPAGERSVLIGHSSSCQVVAHAGALAPERVTGLLLVGPTTDPRAATWPRPRDRLRRRPELPRHLALDDAALLQFVPFSTNPLKIREPETVNREP